jgi:hypothetical protein
MASNTLLTSSIITREAQRILHQKLNFITNINRQYDDSFAKTGAKNGATLGIRLPNKFSVRTGATYSSQNSVETKVDLTVATQKGVDFEFSSAELSLSVDDFSKRYLEPAMSTLAATMEADALSMTSDVWNYVGADASAITVKNVFEAGKALTDNLAPLSQRCVILDTQARVDLLDATKGLFQDAASIGKQYVEGIIGRMGGFDWYENTLIPRYTSGTAATTTGYTVNGATQSGSTITIQAGTTTFLVGDIVTFAGCFRVHPETKVSTGVLQKFVVTANSGTSATSLSISPALTISGVNQNVSGYPTNGGAVVGWLGNAAAVDQSLAFHKDAFAFVSADLEMPKGTDMAAREVMDGLSMRFVRDFDIGDDLFKSRFDVLYGYKAIRPELACRLISN